METYHHSPEREDSNHFAPTLPYPNVTRATFLHSPLTQFRSSFSIIVQGMYLKRSISDPVMRQVAFREKKVHIWRGNSRGLVTKIF